RLYGDANAATKMADSNSKHNALEHAEMKVRHDPTARNHTKLVNALFDIGRFEYAERDVNKHLQSYGEDLQALADLGFIYKNMGKREASIKTFQRVVAVQSRRALARCAENEIWMMDPSFKPSWMKK